VANLESSEKWYRNFSEHVPAMVITLAGCCPFSFFGGIPLGEPKKEKTAGNEI